MRFLNRLTIRRSILRLLLMVLSGYLGYIVSLFTIWTGPITRDLHDPREWTSYTLATAVLVRPIGTLLVIEMIYCFGLIFKNDFRSIYCLAPFFYSLANMFILCVAWSDGFAKGLSEATITFICFGLPILGAVALGFMTFFRSKRSA